MESICKQLRTTKDDHVFQKYDSDFDLDQLAKKYKVSILFNDGVLHKSHSYGPEIFVIRKEGFLVGHCNPGKLAKLPSGVNKVKGCKYKLSELINQDIVNDCCLDSNWDEIERKFEIGINIWQKVTTGLNKCVITNLKRSKLKKSIHLHCDPYFCKVFLVTCDKLYFRGHRYLINQGK